jgi:hypothetical protein
MATRSISYRAKPQIVTSNKLVGMIGPRNADFIRASGHAMPHTKAGHMTAPDHAIKPNKPLATQGPSTHDAGG